MYLDDTEYIAFNLSLITTSRTWRPSQLRPSASSTAPDFAPASASTGHCNLVTTDVAYLTPAERQREREQREQEPPRVRPRKRPPRIPALDIATAPPDTCSAGHRELGKGCLHVPVLDATSAPTDTLSAGLRKLGDEKENFMNVNSTPSSTSSQPGNSRIQESCVLQALPNGLLTPPVTQSHRDEGSRGNGQRRETGNNRQTVWRPAGPHLMAARREYHDPEARREEAYSSFIVVAYDAAHLSRYFRKMVPLESSENFDINYHAVVHVSEVPTNINKDNSTFEIHADRYLSATKNIDNVFPVRCGFPDTPRWKKYKPIPGKGKPVSIEGLLTGDERNHNQMVKHFIVDLEKVTFHAQAPAAPKAEESPTKLAYTGTPGRLKFTGFFGSQGMDEKSEEPVTKKCKTADDRAIEESEDKGEGTSTGRRATNTRY
ncbi:hypothetical protein B0H19DRAFT_1076606 [Mycena capillaripes]|nr:hypothetical protein B0H19DRAFT_1076606 [Mycena capillaripes]